MGRQEEAFGMLHDVLPWRRVYASVRCGGRVKKPSPMVTDVVGGFYFFLFLKKEEKSKMRSKPTSAIKA